LGFSLEAKIFREAGKSHLTSCGCQSTIDDLAFVQTGRKFGMFWVTYRLGRN